MAKHEGTVVSLGGQEYTIPPLSLRGLRKVQPQLKIIFNLSDGELPTEEQIEAISIIVHEALKRNYPDITLEVVEELIDLDNLSTVLPAAMTVAGLEKRLALQGGAARPVT